MSGHQFLLRPAAMSSAEPAPAASGDRAINIDIELANGFWARFLGLMFRRPPPDGSPAMLLTRCASIHTAFMRFALDIVWLDSNGYVIGTRANLKPWRLARGPRGAAHTLEFPAGQLSPLRLQAGDRIEHPHFTKVQA